MLNAKFHKKTLNQKLTQNLNCPLMFFFIFLFSANGK